MKRVLEFDQKCKSCDGTGLYVGLAERDGSAVVCHHCKGKGEHHTRIEYEDPEPRKQRPEVLRVLQINPGICVETGNGHTLERFGGMDYGEWLAGRPFPEKSEMREFTCPAWWYQSADYEKKPDWDECRGCGTFSGCKSFPDKAACWGRFDREQAQ